MDDSARVAQQVAIVGQGYVGLPVAVRAAEAGYQVTGFDTDKAKIDGIATGSSPVEDVGDDRLRALLAAGSYVPTFDVEALDGFDIAIISVPTPLLEGVPDLSFIEAAAKTLSTRLTPGSTVILESTTYPGTTDEVVRSILEEGSGLTAGSDFHLGYSPERIDPGNQHWTFERTPKVVSGLTEECLDAVTAFYSRLVDQVVPVQGIREAELTKLLENTFRHVNIALVNELAMFAHALGIDIWQAIDAASTKPFGYMRFTPGPGVGGHCLPIDPSYLSWQVRRSLGHTFRFVELANDVNDHMPDYVVQRTGQILNDLSLPYRGSRIVLLGLSYKRNTGDARETPAIPIARQLVELGAEVLAVDPHVDPSQVPAGVKHVPLTPEVLSGSDLVVLLVDHDVFDPTMIVEHAGHVFDTRHCLDGPNVHCL